MIASINGAGSARQQNRFTLTLQRGRASPLPLQAATKQITAKATGTMLANGHKSTKQSSVLACRTRPERIYARTNKRNPSSLHKSQNRRFL